LKLQNLAWSLALLASIARILCEEPRNFFPMEFHLPVCFLDEEGGRGVRWIGSKSLSSNVSYVWLKLFHA
jgi:hypothetical protein